MPTPIEDYRWQDHVARLGSIDFAVAIVTAAILVMIVMADRPSRSRGSAGMFPDRVPSLVADASPAAAVVTAVGCDRPGADPGRRRTAPRKEDA